MTLPAPPLDLAALRKVCEGAPQSIRIHYPDMGPGPVSSCGEPTEESDQFYDAARSALPAALDEIERLRELLVEALDLAAQLDNYVPKFPAEGGPTQTQRRLGEIKRDGGIECQRSAP